MTAVLDGRRTPWPSLSDKNRAGWFRKPARLAAVLNEMADLCVQARTADMAGDEVAAGNLVRQVLNVMDMAESVQACEDLVPPGKGLLALSACGALEEG